MSVAASAMATAGKSYNIFDRGGNILSDLASAMDGAMDEKFQNMSRQMARYLADSTLAASS